MDWSYHEHKLNKRISEFVECVWWENYSAIYPRNNQHFLVPDKSIELIFTPTDIKRFFPSTRENKIRKSQLAGLRTIPQICTVIESPIINIRFSPKKFYRLCKTELTSIIDNNLDPKECFGESILDLEKQVFEAPSQQHRISLIELYFEQYLNTQIREDSDELFEKILVHIENSLGTCVIGDLPNLFKISASSIERKFKKKLGLTPKKYCRLIRFVYQFLSREDSFPDYIQNKGSVFFDQAHFIKEMRCFSGLTPKQLSSFYLGIQEVNFKKKSN